MIAPETDFVFLHRGKKIGFRLTEAELPGMSRIDVVRFLTFEMERFGNLANF